MLVRDVEVAVYFVYYGSLPWNLFWVVGVSFFSTLTRLMYASAVPFFGEIERLERGIWMV
jgi:hypothetical protein